MLRFRAAQGYDKNKNVPFFEFIAALGLINLFCSFYSFIPLVAYIFLILIKNYLKNYHWVIYKFSMTLLKIDFKPSFPRLLIQFSEIFSTDINLIHLSFRLVRGRHENNYEHFICKNVTFLKFLLKYLFSAVKTTLTILHWCFVKNLEKILNKLFLQEQFYENMMLNVDQSLIS